MSLFKDIKRRSVLKAGAAGLAVAAAPTVFVRNAWAKNFRNDPSNVGKVVFGFNVPQTGSYADEGADELRAYRLAVKHINSGGGGMIDTMMVNGGKALKGGVLGQEVTFVTGDTRTKADAARESAKRMIERDGVIMYSGGSSSSVAVAQQNLAQEMGVIFMCGLTHSNDTTGKDKRRYGFRHFFNAYMSGQALGPVLAKEFGEKRAFHLTADYNWGHTQYSSIKDATEAQGWETAGNIMTPLGSPDFTQYFGEVYASGADMLVLNHYGRDMVNSLSQAVQFGLRDRVDVVVPLYSRLMAQGAGDNVAGVLGTTNWNWNLQDEGSQAFVKAFEAEYGFPPSQAAQTCYVQTLLYANAVESVGTFYPPEVIKALEDAKITGMGPGDILYRGSDHQCFKDILVVRGKPASERTSQFDLLKIEQQVSGESLIYDPAIFGGELGPYEV